jgi:heme exporter protein CcmD
MMPSYAAYVWSAYAISGVVLAATIAIAWTKWLAAKRRLAALKDSETNL